MSLFHYVTYKYIIIKDKRLGIAYYCLAGLILLYTVVQIFVNKAYLQFDFSPKGNIRILVTTPPNKDSYNLSYCCTDNPTANCEACRGLDGLSLNWPVESKAVTVASYVKERWEKQECNGNFMYDQTKLHTPYTVVRENDFYSVNPENALIKIEHSISAVGDQFSASHRMMNGVLLTKDGQILKKLNSKKSSRVDKIWLSEFLQAANVSLNATSDALNANGRTYRQNGIVLHVMIEYKNADFVWFGIGKPEYRYHVKHVTFSDYRVKQEIPIINSEGTVCERLVNKRYATRLEFSQRGKIGQYSLSNLLFQLVSFMGLLTLTATVIDIIALYLVPNKDLYRQYVFDSSPELRKPIEIKETDEKEKEE